MSFVSKYNITSIVTKVGSFIVTVKSDSSISALKVSGILKIKHGFIYLKLFGYRSKNSYYQKGPKSSNNIKILGILNNGHLVKCEKFNWMNGTFNHRCNNKCYFIDTFLIYELKLKNIKGFPARDNQYQLGINIEQFLYWSYYPGVLSDNKIWNKYSLPPFIFNNINYRAFISYYTNSHDSTFFNETAKHAVLHLVTKYRIKNKDAFDFSKEFCKLMELLTYRHLSLLNISMAHQKYSVNYLYSTEVKPPHVNYQWINECLSMNNIIKFMGYNGFFNIFKRYIGKTDRLTQMINALLNSYYIKNSVILNLVNYASSIESYFKRPKFSNGNEIKKLSDKIRLPFIMRSFPKDILLLILHTTDETKIKKFSIKIANTRNNYIHPKKEYTDKILKDLDLSTSSEKLYWLLYYFILIKLGVSKYLAKIFIKTHINGTSKSNYL